MISEISDVELAFVARNGASLTIDGSAYNSAQIAKIAENLTPSAHMRICNSGRLSSAEMVYIAKKGKVIFE